MRIVLALVAVALLIPGYFWLVLTWSYSTGERAGWIQKLSKKGWACKTWEGELAMVSMPGAILISLLHGADDGSPAIARSG